MNTADCMRCGRCTENCDFLHKYQLMLTDTEALTELCYHCFGCGRCTEVCPKNIDGRELIHQMRIQKIMENHGKIPEYGYTALLLEKKKYLFRNYRKAKGRSILFPGCNFPSFFPETTDALVRICESMGIGVAWDCCGKPIDELGLTGQAENILKKITGNLAVEEIITVCPNCYQYLKEHLKIRVVMIYEKIPEWKECLPFVVDELDTIDTKDVTKKVFLPCPDRENRKILDQITTCTGWNFSPVTDVQCCGLGGCAAGKEPDLVQGFAEKTRMQIDSDKETLYTYCASCAGNLNRHDIPAVQHILSVILGVNEMPDSKHAFRNRVLTRWK